jgi:hypothetical protein
MSEDRFYSNVRSVMTDYTPEVPSSVYAGVRKKMWWSDFTRLSATRFNLWYLLLVLGGVGVFMGWSSPSSASEASVVNSSVAIEQTYPVDSRDQAIQQSTSTETAVTEHKRNSTSSHSVGTAAAVTAQSEDKQPESETAHLEQPIESAIITEPKQEAVPAEATTPVTSGSKRGLKVKTYDTSDKKK